MRLPSPLTIENGRLHLAGKDCVSLAGQYGTPLYVTSEDRICGIYTEYEKTLKARYPKVGVLYAAKANGNLAVMRALGKLGAGADVFSPGEIQLALEAGIPAGRLLFNGSSKAPADLTLAVQKGIRVSVDSLDELHQLDEAARAEGKVAEIAFRVNPALEVLTHPKIATGLATSKFGIPHSREALACKNIQPVGIHCHIGSQILALEPFVHATDVMIRIAKEITDIGVKLEFIDIGGGLGIPYHHDSDPVLTPADYAAAVGPVFTEGVRAIGISPDLWVEPGRSLVADSTVLLTLVNSTKSAHKLFANVDAGFKLLVHPAMYESYHEVIAASKADAKLTTEYTVTDPICESGNILAADRKLPELAAGDIIAILDSGAYGYAMASQYNCRPRCPEVLIHGDKATLMRRGETYGDITMAMERPAWQ